MTDSEFLDDLEARREGEWSDEDTTRLWRLRGLSFWPKAHRDDYSAKPARLAIIKQARDRLVYIAINRLGA